MELPDDEPEPRRRKTLQPEEEPQAHVVPFIVWLFQFLTQNVVSLLIGLLAVVLIGFIWWSWAPDLTQTNYDRLKYDMTPAEVRSILGTSANARTPEFVPTVGFPDAKTPPVWKAWEDREARVLICFVDERLRFKQRTPLPGRSPRSTETKAPTDTPKPPPTAVEPLKGY